MKKPQRIYKKNKDIVDRKIDNEIILVPIYRTNTDTNEMYTLNRTASEMWELVDGKRTLGEIRDILSTKYKVSPEELEKDLEEFLKDMREIKAIK